MSMGLIGKKLGMTQIYLEDGEALPVTVIQVAGNQVVQLKRKETDGYSAVQVGFSDKKESRVSKPLLGHFKKHGATPKYQMREFRMDEDKLPGAGVVFGPELFPAGTLVDVVGTTMGKGFQGVVRRYRFKGQPATHGSMMHRRPGSIGCRSTPGLVFKNKKMPGRMGGDRRTIQNLEVVQSRAEDGVLVIKGSVPGATNSYLIIRPAIKKGAVVKKEKQKQRAAALAAAPKGKK
jgi:large subunit ribosomal protein L3